MMICALEPRGMTTPPLLGANLFYKGFF